MNQTTQRGNKCLSVGGKGYLCDFCNKTFSAKKNLVEHKKIHTNNFKYKCLLCGKGIASNSKLAMHTLSHINLKLYKCPVCNKTYKYRDSRNTHVKKTHNMYHAIKDGMIKLILVTDEEESSLDEVIELRSDKINSKDLELFESFHELLTKHALQKPLADINQPAASTKEVAAESLSAAPLGTSVELNILSDTSTWNFSSSDIYDEYRLFNPDLL